MTSFSIEDELVFVRVYRMPAKLTNGYCFGREVPIPFFNVDWFEAPGTLSRDMIVAHVKGKNYYRPTERYLVLSDHEDFTFTLSAEPRSDD